MRLGINQFYENLYSAHIDLSDSYIEEFKNVVILSKLNKLQTLALESLLTMTKPHGTLQHIPNSKVPGTDSFSKEFYKDF